jgi:hygromycin-B 7''-O-kinase
MKDFSETDLEFSSDKHYQEGRDDIHFWQPIVSNVLKRHNLSKKDVTITAGFNSTYPVFLTNDLVIKFYGYRTNWKQTFDNECVSHQCLAQDNRIRTPEIIASGQLFEDTAQSWSYVISTKMQGLSWLDSNLSYEQKKTVVAEVGEQLKYIHALPVNDQLDHDTCWDKLNIKDAARQSSLPIHLIDEIDDFMAQLDPFDKVFVNGDMVAMHVFVKDGHLSGIIDWGDASVTDRHYEIGKLCLSLFPGNKGLLRILLESAHWPLTKSFPTQSLGLALYRQAVGLTQHHTFDIFYKLSEILPINKVTSLDELAKFLF